MAVNHLDIALSLGNPGARACGQLKDKSATKPLSDLTDPGAVYSFSWVKTTGGAKAVACTSLYLGEPVTYANITGEWEPVETKWETSVIVASTLSIEKERLAHENRELKDELSKVRLENELTRHELARARSEQAPRFRFDQKRLFWFLLAILFGLIAGASAEETRVHDNWQQEYFFKAINYTQDLVTTSYTELITQLKPVTDYIHYLWYWAGFWPLQCLVLAGVSYFRDRRPWVMVINLIASTWSGTKSIWPIVSGNVCGYGLFTMTMTGFVLPLSVNSAFPVFLASTLIGLTVVLARGENFERAVTSHALVGGMYCLHAVATYYSVTHQFIFLAFLVFKTTKVLVTQPTSIQVRNADGKVVDTLPVAPKQGFLSRMLQRLRQRKPRTEQHPVFNMRSVDLHKIKCINGEGTCFRVGNFIVTAKHVLGGDNLAEVIDYSGASHPTKVKYVHPTKDVVLCTLPTGLQDMVPIKVANHFEHGPAMLLLETGDRFVAAPVTAAHFGEELTYAVRTPDGSSGAPVVDPTGKLIGIHVINTGFSAGGVFVDLSDLEPPKPSKSEVVDEVAPTFLEQKFSESEIVGLIRQAIAAEMRALRMELAMDDDFLQAKGKTKRGKTWRRNATHNRVHSTEAHTNKFKKDKKKAVWTEEEYKRLLEKGYTAEQLREMADDIRDRGALVAAIEDDTEEGGFPEWDDPDSDYEEQVNEDWFGQAKKPSKAFQQAWDDHGYLPDYDDPTDYAKYELTAAEVKLLPRDVRILAEQFKNTIEHLRVSNVWEPSLDKQRIYAKLSYIWWELNAWCDRNGITPFYQSRVPKNRRGGRKPAPKPVEVNPKKDNIKKEEKNQVTTSTGSTAGNKPPQAPEAQKS
nr:ORF1a [Bat astrovirus BtSY1]